MTDKWPKVALGECCEIVSGATPKTGVEEYWDGDIYWATPKDLSVLPGVYLEKTERSITASGLRSCAARILPPGSVLLSSRAPIGHVAINRVPVATNQGFKSLVPGDTIDAKYLYYWLRTNRAMLESLGNGATFKEVSKAIVAGVELPLPPLEEQRRIADVLDRVDTLRAKRRAALDLLGAARTAAFVHMFGDPILNDRSWKRVALGALVERIHSGRSPICLDRPASEGEWAVLKLGAVTSGEFRPAENKALPVTVAPRAEDEVRAGDILFSRKNTRDLVAACVLVRSTPARRLMPDLMFRLELKEEAPVVAEYLHALLSYPPKRRTVQDLASGSAGSMPNISKANLATVAVEVPPLDLQREFASAISSIEKAEVVQRRALGELDALFASLQHRAFRGEL
ncbi:restriction endonuclease subunit S [Solwaraspora sp. WMMA2065]|uniref:restriction endonuclease subunit S n=1 Tax=Solwaraspora sp. WMMA2065 TaxID=3015166 RepID=UPI00259B0970|nr:restriction endonuclease subunit S [Solwaraspora sp. WMMA2065]WJK37244.1 restriction endonuclease subunit S [Solwaraspora sp. WMMA2065]